MGKVLLGIGIEKERVTSDPDTGGWHKKFMNWT